jgi:hypothetical protein
MNYIPVHTNIVPNYNYLSAENAYLRQNIEYKDAVLCEQQVKMEILTRANQQLQLDAQRWQKFKRIIDAQKGELNAEQLQNIVDHGHRDAG